MSCLTKQALEIVDAVLMLPPDQRSAYLDRMCLDVSLRLYVESLLSSYEEAQDFLTEPAFVGSSNVPEPESADGWVGRQVGPYHLIEEIGEGGMGVVYRAVRADDQYHKEVAIKLLRSGLDSGSTLVRFKAERQILASLEHPNIARLFDGGATAEGSPYFVMELVDGLSIDDYCNSHKLATVERLKLFRAVCAAVQYAHNRSVIHRDLKPGNVLVTEDGTPKLLDFGIAKILDPNLFPGTAIEPTRTMMRVLTPEFASPEQMRGEPTGPQSDVYSLGVILYIVLSGHRPYTLRSQSPLDVAKAICEIDPPKPSDVLRRIDEITKPDGTTESITPQSVSLTRNISIGKLRRCLAGDVDNIVLKALHKEPARRYASVEELSEDIRRHLENLPVVARRDAAFYRLAKFAHRNVAMVGAAFLVLLAAAIGIGSFVWLKHTGGRLRQDQPRAVNMRPSIAVLGFKNLSGREQSGWLSTALSEMLNTELSANEKLRTVPGENVARMKTEIKLVDSESFAPDTLFRVRTNLGADYVIVGSYLETESGSKAQVRLDLRLQDANAGDLVTSLSEVGKESELGDIIARAADSIRSRLGVRQATPQETAAVQAALPSATTTVKSYAEGLIALRNFDVQRARPLLEQAIKADPTFALAHSALATAWSQLGYDAKAVDECKRAVDLSAGLPREDRLWIAALYSEAAHDWPKAIELYRTLYNFFPDNLDYGLRLADVQNKGGKANDALLTVQSLRNLPAPGREHPAIDLAEAASARSVSDYKRQLKTAKEARRKADAAEMRSLAARALVMQSIALRGLAEPGAAVAAVTAGRRLYEEIHDRNGFAVASNSLGNILYETGDLAGAKKAYEAALNVFRETANNHATASALGNLSNVVGDLGDLTGAIKLNDQSLAIYRQIDDKVGIANALNDRGTDLTLLGDLAAAARALQQSMVIDREIGDQNGVARCLNNIGDVLAMRGELAKAQSSFEQAIKIRRSLGHLRDVASPLQGLGDVMAAGGDLTRANQFLQESLTITHQSGDKHVYALALASIGRLRLQEGSLLEARKSYQQATDILKGLGEKGNSEEIALALAEVDLEDGRPEDARLLVQEALNEFTKEKLIDDQIFAHAVLAQAFLAENKTGNARLEIIFGKKLASKSQNRFANRQLDIASARVDFAEGKLSGSLSGLEKVLADAKQHGLVPLQFQASLVLGEIEFRSGEVRQGQERLERLKKDATSKGFLLMAQRAQSVLSAVKS
jgi:serine/threonine protein kinase/tetratricopeptide (TPR) repeat protein